MKTYALIAVGLLASHPLAASAETQQGLFTLNATQMDSVTAGIQIPGSQAAILAAAEAMGSTVLTGTNAATAVLGFTNSGAVGNPLDFIVVSGGVATATGDESRSTSVSSNDGDNGTTSLGVIINASMAVGPTQISAYSSVQPSGLATHNMLAQIGFWSGQN